MASSSSRALVRALTVIGKVSKEEIMKKNSEGEQWLRAIDTASQTVQEYYAVDAISFSGSKAHQSHEVATHSVVISAKFSLKKQRVISGHIHLNGEIDLSAPAKMRDKKSSDKSSGSGKSGSSSHKWQPSRDQVNVQTWKIWDMDKQKERDVTSDGQDYYVVIGKKTIRF